jgi:hypothetical protein
MKGAQSAQKKEKPDEKTAPVAANDAPPPAKASAPQGTAHEGRQTYAASDRRNSSIVVGPKTLATVAGPINEWACIPENLPNHPTMAFFGKRRTGKSTTITNIAYHCCQNIPFGIVMSDTAYAGYWEKILPKRHIVQGLRQDVSIFIFVCKVECGNRVNPLSHFAGTRLANTTPKCGCCQVRRTRSAHCGFCYPRRRDRRSKNNSLER